MLNLQGELLLNARISKVMMQFWPLAAEAQEMLHRAYAPALWEVGKAFGLSATVSEWLTFLLGNFDVAPISARLLWLRLSFASPQVYEMVLATLVDFGLLTTGDSEEYRFTDSARKLGWQLYTAKHVRLANIEVMSSTRLERLASLLHRIVHASRVAPRPVCKRWLTSRCAYLAQNASPLARIGEYLADMSAYRDDCYQATWQRYNIDGWFWQSLTLLWRRGTATPVGLAKRLHTQNPRESDPVIMLDALRERGWVEATVNASRERTVYYLTAAGRTAHAEVETLAAALFYAPWTVLPIEEVNELQELLTEMTTADGSQSVVSSSLHCHAASCYLEDTSDKSS